MKWEEILVAVIGVLGAVITAAVALYQFRKEQWTKNVTAERMDWLKSFRDEVGKIFACLEMLAKIDCGQCNCKNADSGEKADANATTTHCCQGECCCDKMCDHIYEAEKARHILYTRLRSLPTFGNELNMELKDFLLDVKFTKDYAKNFIASQECVSIKNTINFILEREWDKVKDEAHGTK